MNAIGGKPRIALDLMGGDHAPHAAIEGCMLALEKHTPVIALGTAEAVELLISKVQDPNLTSVVCNQVITSEESPVRAVRTKSDSTIVRGLTMVKNKEASAFVSAGSTGALLAGGVLILGRAEGVDRPCLGMVLPSKNDRGVLVMDLGASADVQPQNLIEFALMGKIYAERVLGWDDPRVGLLNIGTEANKGTATTKKAYTLLENAPLNFIGNVEARDVFFDKADIIITDGFTGNILLKTCEGALLFQISNLKKAVESNFRSKIGALLLRPALYDLVNTLDYSNFGGAPMLGLEGCVVKCHGSSDAVAIANGVAQAVRFIESNVASVICETLAEMGLRSVNHD
ncbi:MAG TPA: phosphate acyltransferase PlsX [Bacillota bacterium]|nr:phosphate acyltransferase PlsX [Candidatus Fermentithermobacillaceae bacterium]HOB30080.1 phosphate acyltransferase PlsX [Bacillota bacterium]HOK63970.1 phosphate acyltransferase PlsX [Bacillota bacterium]HOL11325.1 phosphate acyltransferase PlsX [Bacillota bacterium]HOQ02454.1 phosphate acyltransferase PlsX [Bacillota bacterium]